LMEENIFKYGSLQTQSKAFVSMGESTLENNLTQPRAEYFSV
jgi:hypothetical protein